MIVINFTPEAKMELRQPAHDPPLVQHTAT